MDDTRQREEAARLYMHPATVTERLQRAAHEEEVERLRRELAEARRETISVLQAHAEAVEMRRERDELRERVRSLTVGRDKARRDADQWRRRWEKLRASRGGGRR